jgi:hypothetical protein
MKISLKLSFKIYHIIFLTKYLMEGLELFNFKIREIIPQNYKNKRPNLQLNLFCMTRYFFFLYINLIGITLFSEQSSLFWSSFLFGQIYPSLEIQIFALT